MANFIFPFRRIVFGVNGQQKSTRFIVLSFSVGGSVSFFV